VENSIDVIVCKPRVSTELDNALEEEVLVMLVERYEGIKGKGILTREKLGKPLRNDLVNFSC
jgi:hypothetical protein